MTEQVTTTAYGRPALQALRAAVARLKRDDLMAPVTVLVPNNIAGIVARRFLARGLTDQSNGIAGIYLSTLPRLAERLAAPTLTASGRRPATRPVTAAAIRLRLDRSAGIFEPVAGHASTARALGQAITALRDVSDSTLTTLGSASSLLADVVRLHRETVTELRQRWYDTTDLLHTATDLVRDRLAATADLGPVLLYLPQDLSGAEVAFARSLAERGNLEVIVALTGSARADQGVLATLTSLAPGLRLPTAGPVEPLAARVLNASDSDDEVRCVVREVVRELRSAPAHRIAVLYADRSPYARLLHEHLASAGITVNGPGVRPVNERAVSRLVLGLLEAGRTGFGRADLLRTLGEAGARDFAEASRRPPALSASGLEGTDPDAEGPLPDISVTGDVAITVTRTEEEVASQCVAEGVVEFAPLVTSFVRSMLGSQVVRRAATREHWRESYVGMTQQDGTVLEGFVDLIYREDDGLLVIVDYKTDEAPDAALPSRVGYYAPQLNAYRSIVETAVDGPSATPILIFARESAARSLKLT